MTIKQRTLWIAARLPGLFVGISGLVKLTSPARWTRLFASWGYPDWWAYVTGVVEITGAILVFTPKTSRYGTLLLAVTMLAAFVTLWTHRGGTLGWGSTPLTYCIWLTIVTVVSWNGK
jgi:uncharacterized membrane protein YphA (DoxX/SURF4 family)